jgi:Tol biopolymer transport system component
VNSPDDGRHVARRSAVLLAVCLVTSVLVVRPAQAVWRNLTDPVQRFNVFVISPDSRFVVYIAAATRTAPQELFSVALAGGMPTKLNPPLVADGTVDRFGIMPDGTSVVYTATQDTATVEELYVVPIGGGQARKLNGPLVAGGNVDEFVLDPATERALYVADEDTAGTFELYSVPLTGGAVVKLNPPLVAGGNVSSKSLQVDPSSKRAVYLAEQEVAGRTELFSVPAAGGTSTKLNADDTMVTGDSFEIAPGAPVVVFQAANVVGQSHSGLFSNAVAGGFFTTLSFPLAPGLSVFGFHISPDGAHVVYNVVTSPAELGELFTVPIGGGLSPLITDTADPGFGTFGAEFGFTADSSRVVYIFQKIANTAPGVVSSTLDGSRASLFSPTSFEQGLVRLSPDGQWVLVGNDANQLFSVPPTGGNLSSLGSGKDAAITPDSTRVLFEVSTATGTNPHQDLFSEQISGGDQRNLSGAGDHESAENFQVSPDSRSIVFVLGLADGSVQLRVSDGTEAQGPTTTTTTLPAGGSTTTLPGTTPTTLPPPRQEICDNCVDDDGNGLTDLEDPACCATNVALSFKKGLLRGTKRSATRLALTATLADASLVPSAGAVADVHVQIGAPGRPPLLCADLPAASLALKKAKLRFRDKAHAVAGARGLDQLLLVRKKNGSASLVLGGSPAFAVPPPETLRIGLETQAGRCAAGDASFAGNRKGLHLH